MKTTDFVHFDNVTTPNVSFTIADGRLCDVLVVSVIALNAAGEGDEFVQNWSLGGMGLSLGLSQ